MVEMVEVELLEYTLKHKGVQKKKGDKIKVSPAIADWLINRKKPLAKRVTGSGGRRTSTAKTTD